MECYTFLDEPAFDTYTAINYLFIALPLVAVGLLIYFFVKRKSKNK